LLCIELSNDSDKLIKLKGYATEALYDNKWIKLQPIPFSEDGQFYTVYDRKNKIGRSIDFKQGTFEEQVASAGLKPGETITAIVMLYLKNPEYKKYIPRTPRKIKLFFFRPKNHIEEHLINVEKKEFLTDRADIITFMSNVLCIKVKEIGIDLKRFHIVNDY